MLKKLYKYKKIIIVLGIIITLPFTLPLITIIFKFIFDAGFCVGKFVFQYALKP